MPSSQRAPAHRAIGAPRSTATPAGRRPLPPQHAPRWHCSSASAISSVSGPRQEPASTTAARSAEAMRAPRVTPVAAPAAAQPSWEMPDVEGEVLQDAWDKVVSTTDGAVVPETATAEGPPFEQFNLKTTLGRGGFGKVTF